MISEISHAHWLSNHAFTGACAGDNARMIGYVTVQCHIASQANQKQQVPVLQWSESSTSNPEVVGSSPPSVT
jgi:hypothetical protein